MKLIFTFLLILISSGHLIGQNATENLKVFARAYGYVKYFHPSTENKDIDWNKFSAYGANQIFECKNQEELVETLNKLFIPIGPNILFSNSENNFKDGNSEPINPEEYDVTYWQHLGVARDMLYENHQRALYKSVLVNQSKLVDDSTTIVAEPIFEEFPKIEEYIKEELGDSVFISMPLSLYIKDDQTYPKSNEIIELVDKIESFEIDSTSLAMRIGNVINIYNVIQHFYPYFEEVDVDWAKELKVALQQCFMDETVEDHETTLQRYTASIKDGHVWMWQGYTPFKNYPEFHWDWIEDSLVITQVLNDSLQLNIGDVVTHINGKSSEEHFEEVYSRISYPTDGFRNFKAKTISYAGQKNSTLAITIAGKLYQIKRKLDIKQLGKSETIEIQKYEHKKISEDIIYLNISSITYDSIKTIFHELETAKGIICDFRGYTWGNSNFISHLTKENLKSDPYKFIMGTIYPNQENNKISWENNTEIEAAEPFLGDKEVVFIIDGRTVSAAEDYLLPIKHFDLATIIGENSAGTNGNRNGFKLLGDYTMWWTGMKITQLDGSQFHSVGIIPDVILERSINGVRSGKDEFLYKAIEIIKEKIPAANNR